MMLYFCAALGFLVTGILMVYISRGHFWSMIFYGVMILAALFGIAASCFANKDPAIEGILNFISVHLFALEAILIVIARFRKLNQMDGRLIHDKEKKHHRASEFNVLDSCLGLPMIAWMAMGDISFFLGTSGDVVLSYFYLVKQDYLEHAVASVITASFWLLSALIYCGVSSFALRRTKKIFKEEGWYEKPSDGRKVQLTIVVLVVMTVVIIVLGITFGVDTSNDESALVEEGTFAPSEINTGMSTDATLDTQSPMGACNMTMSTFSQSTMAITMAVMSSITAIEVRPLRCPIL
jgi:MFS family permease